MNPFIGKWRGPDEYTSEVEYSVEEVAGAVRVTAMDPSDGETADVSDIELEEGQLSFTALWRTTGRSARCLIELVGENEARLTFTYTDHAQLVRTAV